MWTTVHAALTLLCVGSAVGSWLAARRIEDQRAEEAARHRDHLARLAAQVREVVAEARQVRERDRSASLN